MRQVTDPRAPFPDIETAIAVAVEFVKAQGGSFCGAFAERQHGGYFVRVSYTTALHHGSRSSRNRRQSHTVEIGKISASDVPGTEEGQLCRRDGCPGVIELVPDPALEGCSCHLNPPCGYCTSIMPECPICQWRDAR